MTDTALEDVDFLARSEHRVAVLRTLADEAMTRPDLHEETGISQPTLGRVLGAFEARNWVERRGREYALTPLGELVAEQFEELLATVATVQKLGDVIVHLPTGEMEFDLRVFADATVTTPEPGDPLAHLSRIEELWYGADRGRVLIDMIPPGSSADHQHRAERFSHGDQHYESINSATNLDQVLASEESVELFREVLPSERMHIYRYEGDIPLVLGVADGTAFLAPTDEQGVPVALVETENATVREWVEHQLDEYRSNSTELTVADLPE